jgi:hypothetical protein
LGGTDRFEPADVTINVGEKVTWINQSGAHNVVFEDGTFDVPSSAVGPASWPPDVSRTFPAPGVFRYFCELHGTPTTGMFGIVRVNAPVPGPIPPPPGAPPPGEVGPGSPNEPRTPFEVTLRVSDRTPAAGSRVRFFGSVRPARDGGLVLIQRRVRPGTFRTVARGRLKDAGAGRSTYAVRLRIARDGVFRARVTSTADHAAGLSRVRRVNAH